MKKDKEIKSKFWRLLVVIYFLITIPVVICLSFITFDEVTKPTFIYEVEDMDYSNCEDEICIRSTEIAGLIKGTAKLNGDDRSDLKTNAEIQNEFQRINPNNKTSDYIFTDNYNSIGNFAIREGMGIYKKNYFEGIAYIILILISYLLITDILRGASYYVYTGKPEFILLNWIKKIFKK